MDIEGACRKANELVERYNPNGIAPFPFDSLLKDQGDLRVIYTTEEVPENVSGAIVYDKESQRYSILVNNSKPENRQYFTVAHELGHYFLHQENLKTEEVLIENIDLGSSSTLFRLDENLSTVLEREANNFAACLIMPEKFVIEAWNSLEDVEECAKIFKVSVSAMSIRLEKLRLL